MEEIFCKQLVDDYKNNCAFTEALAVNHVASIEIPVFNTLSSLSKTELQECLYKTTTKSKNLSMDEQILIFTILTEVLTGVIKQPDFFNTFEKNNDQIILTLCRKIRLLDRPTVNEEKNVIHRNIAQMLKYSERIDSHLLKDFLCEYQHKMSAANIQAQTNNLLNKFDSLRTAEQYVDNNKNICTKNNILRDMLQTHYESLKNNAHVKSKKASENNTIKENVIETTAGKNNDHVKCDMHSNKGSEVNINKENVIETTAGKKRVANAFEIMMSASKAKNMKP